DEKGRLLDENGRFINEKGEFVDKDGNLVDQSGDYIVEFSPFLDENGKPIVIEDEKPKDKEEVADVKNETKEVMESSNSESKE
ncbi:MAG: hypothetical protein EBS98_07155, partial [Chitinophagia bacterium]|nr:hypothetical protein [Chitinophagia bacterium]